MTATIPRPVLALAAFHALVAAACAAYPLFDTLGYEFAVACAVAAALAAGPFAISMRHRTGATTAGGRLVRIAGWHFAALLPAFVLMTLNGIRVPNCSVLQGAALFLLVPVAAVPFCTALALLLAALLRPARALAVYAALLAAIVVVHPVLQILALPQLYVYNHVFGVFVGFSWDETQPPFGTLALYRVLTLAYVVLLYAAARGIEIRRGPGPRRTAAPLAAVACAALAVAALGTAYDTDLGFANSPRHTRRTLGMVIRSPHFTIAYDGRDFPDDRAARLLALEHEFRLAQVCRALDVRWTGTITSYVYPDDDVKRRLLGTESSEIARPWAREIHLDARDWRESLAHELTHVVAGTFGPYVVRAPILREYGLTEGLATAVARLHGIRTLHQDAAAMLRYGYLPPLRDVLRTTGFLGGAASVGYAASGSFCRWLLDSLGRQAMERAYSADDVEAGTGRSLDELDRRWRAFLRTVLRDTPDSLATAYLYRRPSLFAKVCARVLGGLRRAAAAAYDARRYAEAAALYRESDALAPNASAVFGIVAAELRMHHADSVLACTARVFGDPRRAYTVLPILLWRGDAAWMRGDSAAADSAYAALVRERPAGWPTGTAALRLAALRAPAADRYRTIFTRAFDAGPADSLRARSIADLRGILPSASGNLAPLLLGTRLLADSAFADAAAVLARSAPGALFAEAQRELGAAEEAAGRWNAAAKAYDRAAAAETHFADRDRDLDAESRARWMRDAAPGIRIAPPAPAR